MSLSDSIETGWTGGGWSMKITSWVRDWLRRPKRHLVKAISEGPLREFVYLDEVSVYSILASRRGAIPTEITENQTTSLHNDAGSSFGVGTGFINASFDSKLHASELRGSQVLHKSIIHGTRDSKFKELYTYRRASRNSMRKTSTRFGITLWLQCTRYSCRL